MIALNETHDAKRTSWVLSANGGQSDFPIQNLPFAVFRRKGDAQAWRGGVAIGDRIVDMAAACRAGVFQGPIAGTAQAAAQPTLNHLMSLGPRCHSALRKALSEALRSGAAQQAALEPCLVSQADAEYTVPARIGDFTDFYTSIHHATNAGKLFRPDNPLLPNYQWVPIGYHGRASSIVVSGRNFHRPKGQVKPPDAGQPALAPSARLDLELELGIFVGQANALGDPVSIDQAEGHIFGITLLNDWSARDIQAWEYQPLGPFLAKNFATTISPWIVTMEALAPFRLSFTRPPSDPSPLPYLTSAGNSAHGALDIHLEVLIETAHMRQANMPPARLALSNYRHAYWSAAQLVAHHTVNGCNLQAGDLLGSGTLSGPTPDSAGALLELTEGGKKPIQLANGESRTWLQDGDAVTLRGWCQGPDAVRIGFGDCSATILPAR